MNIYLLPMLIALITTYIIILLIRPLAVRINLTDQPSKRKLHSGSIPIIGGIAMFFGVLTAILVSPYDLNEFNYFLLSILIIVSIGILDDNKEITVPIRIFFQTLVAIVVVFLGELNILSLGNLFGRGEILLNGWVYLVTMVAIIVGINSVNMSDGLHGLAGGNSLVSFLAIVFLSINSSSHESLLISLLFCAVLPVFLINNLCIGISSNKRIFMGDAGSMFIGLSLAWVLIDLSQGEGGSFSPVIALWLFAFPLIEIVSTILRRLNSGMSPFKPDSSHTHHILLKLGYSNKKTLIIILIFSSIMAGIGIIGESYLIAENLMFLGFLLVFVFLYLARIVALRKIKNINQNIE
jgi:UDP-GlcNAc:undecaprenyl-phosphate GlcNAc-1-phosphate transferase